MDDLGDDPIRVMAAIIAAGLLVAGDGMEDGVVPERWRSPLPQFRCHP